MSDALPIWGPAQVAQWSGHREAVLFAHYRGQAPKDQAERFWRVACRRSSVEARQRGVDDRPLHWHRCVSVGRMPEKPSKKSLRVAVKMTRNCHSKVVIANHFRVRPDPNGWFIELLLESRDRSCDRVLLDPVILADNTRGLEAYAAGLDCDPDDSATKSDIPFSESSHIANIVHVSRIGARAETCFGSVSYSDWAEVSRSPAEPSTEETVSSVEVITCLSATTFQKKLILELLIALQNEQARK